MLGVRSADSARSPLGLWPEEPAHLARKMGLVGISSPRSPGRRAARGPWAAGAGSAGTEDPLQGLGAGSSRWLRGNGDAGCVRSSRTRHVSSLTTLLRRRPAPLSRRNGRSNDRIGGRHAGQPRNHACSSSIAAAAALGAYASLSDSVVDGGRYHTWSSGWCWFTSGSDRARLATGRRRQMERTPASLAAEGIVRVTPRCSSPAICRPPPLR